MSSIVTRKWLFNVILILNTHTGSPEPLRPHRNHLPDQYPSISPASVHERVTEPPAGCPSFEAFYTRCEDAGLPRDVWWLYADELYLQNEIKSVHFHLHWNCTSLKSIPRQTESAFVLWIVKIEFFRPSGVNLYESFNLSTFIIIIFIRHTC